VNRLKEIKFIKKTGAHLHPSNSERQQDPYLAAKILLTHKPPFHIFNGEKAIPYKSKAHIKRKAKNRQKRRKNWLQTGFSDRL